MNRNPEQILRRIPVSERLPEKEGIYLVTTPTVKIQIPAEYDLATNFFYTGHRPITITHWYEPQTVYVLTETQYAQLTKQNI